MAKFQYGHIGAQEGNPFPGTLELEINAGKSKGTYTDDENGATITIVGDGLKEAGETDLFKAGNIDHIVFRDAAKNTLLTVDGDYKATDLSDAFAEGGVLGLTKFLFRGKDEILGGLGNDLLFGLAGNDTISGGRGTDAIEGGRGNDVLTGGRHTDMFLFNPSENTGRDIITDFHTTGEQLDYLSATVVSWVKANKGHDTLLTLDTGSTVLLEDVTRTEYQAYLELITPV